jgi:hypothetical protein
MNAVSRIVDFLKNKFPEVETKEEVIGAGVTWLDIGLKEKEVCVEYRPFLGFAFYIKQDPRGFWTNPDEVHAGVETLLPRLETVLNE